MTPPKKLSHTQKSMFYRCPTQYYFRYVRGLKLRPAATMKVGIWGHETMAANFKHQLETGEQLPPKDFCGHWEKQFDKGVKKEDIAWEGVPPGEYKDRFLGTEKRLGLMPELRKSFTPQRTPHRVEEEFEIEIPGDPPAVVMGFVDFYGRAGDESTPLIVSDFKFKNRPVYPSKDGGVPLDVLADDQLTLYSLALEAKRCIVEGVTMDFFAHGLKTKPRIDSYRMTRTEADHRRILLEFRELAKRIAQYGDDPEMYPFVERERTPWPCSEQWCGFWKLCPRGGGDYGLK
jgi:hypothetical protein